ncbi:uncharacterized protein LOC133512696 isoform X5 [Syngnathoides biaculeatus]|uniref:uncharacterized protein LOC133512696 isoform X5 n=1 Tax=Syngnathoides biaculeatus TaxID=300417 RepID=UPI002ADDBFA2|nr:uncharacterized protein LOC133512696 isoform X5 [Syngnathoides biaculeatus]
MKSGTQKPPLAPKPKLSPLQPGAPSDRSLGSSHKVKPRLAPKPDLSELNSKPVASKIPSNAVGKSPPEPNWDRILPVCLCSQQNCRCVRDSHVNGTLQQVKGPQNGKTASPERKADRAKRAIAHASTLNGRLENRRAPRGTSPALGVRVGREITQDRAAPVPEADANVSEQKQQPVIPRKPSPVPVPRRLKTTWLAHQEKAEDETLIQEGRRRVQELKVSSEGKGVTLTAAGKGASPAPTPRKKSHLVTSPAPSPLQNNLDEEEDLGCDVNAGQTEMEQSVDEEGEGEARRTSDRDGRDSSLRSCGPDHPNDGAPELVPRSNSPTAWLKKTQSLEVEEDLKSGASVENQTTVTRDLPPLPGNRSRTATRRPGSFSAADSVCSQGARKSFRKRLDLRLSAMMLSKVTAKGSQTAESGQRDGPQNVRGALGAGGGFSRPLVGLEQSVDGDERDLDYENICHYEEVSDYENVYFGGSEGSGTTWQSLDDDGGGIYEYPEAYLSPDENADDDDDGSSADEDASDADFTPPFSDEDDWSLSSHDDVAHSEENALQSGPRMSKSHHVATEIMTSEKVFVDVLKLLHVDFRDAVAKASRQSDKAVIEDGVLNQILYYLPQLYQLNRDLLRELRSRLAKWDEKEQVADIFVKKGPYLKMYSAYIRQFDKNVALLEEHSKKNAAFAGVVRQFEASPRCANLALKHYLLKPVQRIPQYQLLFRGGQFCATFSANHEPFNARCDRPTSKTTSPEPSRENGTVLVALSEESVRRLCRLQGHASRPRRRRRGRESRQRHHEARGQLPETDGGPVQAERPSRDRRARPDLPEGGRPQQAVPESHAAQNVLPVQRHPAVHHARSVGSVQVEQLAVSGGDEGEQTEPGGPPERVHHRERGALLHSLCQFASRERRVAGGPLRRRRRLHQEKDQLHIRKILPRAPTERRRRSSGQQSADLDPGPARHHVHDLHLRVHSDVEAAPLSGLRQGGVPILFVQQAKPRVPQEPVCKSV